MRKIKKTFQVLCCCLAFSLTSLTAIAQKSNNFKTIVVDKQVKDFPEKYSKATPMDAFVSISNITMNGKLGLWRAYSTSQYHKFFPEANTPDKEIAANVKNNILNREIKECILYRDSAAAVITTSEKESQYLIRYLRCENNEWLNAGENMLVGLTETRANIYEQLPIIAGYLRLKKLLDQTPTDTINFTNHIKTHGKHPKDYVLDKLAKHQLVIYGEMHGRPASWNLLRGIIDDPKFAETTGIVFMEFVSYHQKELDRFYEQEKLDISILLNIFGDQQVYGWLDKGQFDFMLALRELNQKLPAEKKIKVVLADYQFSMDSIKTRDQFMAEMKNAKDRNTQMADVIEQTIESSDDSRNSLFIVGFGHSYKTHIPGMASTAPGQKPALSAAAQLVERFSDEAIFSILPHCATMNNSGFVEGKVRNGIFDYVFDVNGNKPIAFDLKGSPFGREPFDALLEVKYNPQVGTYNDNYDGYIFFGKLEDEMKGELLLELFTDDFVNELKRRATILGTKRVFNTPVENLNKEDIIEGLKKKCNQ